MDFFLFPSKRPTPAEYSVLTVVASLLLLVFGGVAVVMGYWAPPEKVDVAREAMRYGVISIGAGLVILIAHRLVRWFLDSE